MPEQLTNTEQRIYDVLAAHPGEFVSPETLLVEGCQYQVAVGASQTIRPHISNMRAKGLDIVAGRGRGYYLCSAGGIQMPPPPPPLNSPSHACTRCGQKFTVQRPSRARRIASSRTKPAGPNRRLFDAMVAAGWVRVASGTWRPSYWVCPDCVQPHEAERRAQATDELAAWRAKNAQRRASEVRCG